MVATSRTDSIVEIDKNLASHNSDKGQEDNSSISKQEWPERKKLPPLPEGEITQEVGEAYCKKICQIFQIEVIDGKDRQKNVSKGAKASRNVKNGHSNKCKQGGLRPTAKDPHGLKDKCEVK